MSCRISRAFKLFFKLVCCSCTLHIFGHVTCVVDCTHGHLLPVFVCFVCLFVCLFHWAEKQSGHALDYLESSGNETLMSGLTVRQLCKRGRKNKHCNVLHQISRVFFLIFNVFFFFASSLLP